MSQIDKFIPVYASPKDKQIKFYFVTTTSDCPICMSFHTSPQITNCGHIFCKDCLSANKIHFGLCPICYYYICDTFEVKWLFTNEVKKNDWCTFIKVNYKDGDNLKNFEFNPFSRKYFLQGEGCFSDEFFYQINDGGYYFLESEAIRKGKKWSCMPEIIVGKVFSFKRMFVSKDNHFGLKPYIGLSIYFVKLEE